MFGLQFVNEFENMQREMDQVFRGFGMRPLAGVVDQRNGFKVVDKGESFSVKASLPGLDPEKLDINVLGRKLTVAGEFVRPEIPENVRWHRQERRCGSFAQSLYLSADIDAEKIGAEYKQGVLTIDLPKAAAALPKKIEVSVN